MRLLNSQPQLQPRLFLLTTALNKNLIMLKINIIQLNFRNLKINKKCHLKNVTKLSLSQFCTEILSYISQKPMFSNTFFSPDTHFSV